MIYIYNDIYKYTYIFTNIYYTGKVDALLSELISSQLGRSMRLRPWSPDLFFFMLLVSSHLAQIVYDFWVIETDLYTVIILLHSLYRHEYHESTSRLSMNLSRAVSSCWQFQDQCWSGWPAFRDLFCFIWCNHVSLYVVDMYMYIIYVYIYIYNYIYTQFCSFYTHVGHCIWCLSPIN
jgi:hypothetical protein